jgi:cleavage and polyadenylation specificity factor subunit 1
MTESAVSLKLPTFWASQPRAWFVQAEAQFTIRGITQDSTKYAYLVSSLDQQTAERILDVLEAPPTSEKYETLKDRLLSTFSLSEQERASRLLNMSGQGDRRPSDLMDEMLALLGTHRPCFLFVELFRQQLPTDIRLALATTAASTDLRALAQEADKLWASRSQPVALATQAAQPSIMAARHSNAPKARLPKQQESTSEVCFYHKKFGAEARRCRPPCKFQGNDQAGRQ